MPSSGPLGIARARRRSLDKPAPRRFRLALLDVEHGQQPEDAHASLGHAERVGSLDGLERDPLRLVVATPK